MFSLTINFGPTGTAWAFLFKDKEKADEAYALMCSVPCMVESLVDDFGQKAVFKNSEVHGIVLEDLEQVEAARIYRSLAEERIKVKLMAAAKSDPLIAEAMRRAQGAPVLTPMGGVRG